MGWWFSRRRVEREKVEPTSRPGATNRVNALVDQAMTLAKSGDTKGALVILDKAIALDPSDGNAYVRRAELKRRLKDEAGAASDMRMAEMALARLEDGLNAHRDAAEAYESGNYRDAISHFNKALSLLPTLTSDYYWRGMAKRFVGDRAGAVEDFTCCIEAEASNAVDAYCARGQVRQDAHDAIADLTRAIEMDPVDPDKYASRAIRMMGNQDYQGALRDLDTVMGMPPDKLTVMSRAEVLGARACAKLELYDFEGALQDETESIDLDQTKADSFVNRGLTKTAMGDMRGAVCDFDRAVQLDPCCADGYYHRGLAKQQLGMHGEGIADIERARELGFEEG